jgi:uncharacterized protein
MTWAAHLQSFSSMLPMVAPSTIPVVRTELAVGDGSLVLECQWQPYPAPVVVVLHGVAGTSQDPYVRRAANVAVSRGMHAIRLNQRGTGLGRALAHTIYHPGLTEDLHIVERFLAEQSQVSGKIHGMHLLGFSLGGHTAMRYAAERRHSSLLHSVATISSPVDLAATKAYLLANRSGMVGVYQWLMVKSILRNARSALMRTDNPFRMPLTALTKIRSLADVEEQVLLPMHGYADFGSFYAQASVLPHAHNIDVPALAIHAHDDPVVPVSQTHVLQEANPLVRTLVAPSGGHIGFHARWSQLRGASLAVDAALQHAAAVGHWQPRPV